MVGVEPSSRESGVRNDSPRMVMQSPEMKLSTTPVAAILRALSVSLAPKRREI